MTSTHETHQTMARSVLLVVFVCFSVQALSPADEATGSRSTGIVFQQLSDTGLNEVLKARRRVLEKRVGGPLQGHAWWLWGLSAFDYDQDGDLDFIVCIHGSKNGLIVKNLWKETGKFRFEDVTKKLGVDGIMPSTDDYPLVWDFDGDGDLDNDGDLDLALSNRRYGQQRVFENLGEGRFEVALDSRGWDADPLVLRDMNDDGRVDVFIGGAGEKENIGIFINETRSVGNYCKLYPRMKSPNIYAVGTRVEIFSAGSLGNNDAQPLLIETAPLDGSPIHVGLGKEKAFDMRVWFPGKLPQEFRNVNAVPSLRITPDSKPVSRK